MYFSSGFIVSFCGGDFVIERAKEYFFAINVDSNHPSSTVFIKGESNKLRRCF